MTVMVEVEKLKQMEEEIARLQRELHELQSGAACGFEPLESDRFLMEAYNRFLR